MKTVQINEHNIVSAQIGTKKAFGKYVVNCITDNNDSISFPFL